MGSTLNQIVHPSSKVLFQELEGEAVLLALDSERYFGLDEVGTHIWHLLSDEHHLAAIHERLLTEYAANTSTLRRDLEEFITSLAQAGLVRVETNGKKETTD